jgi:hypothetical protein
MEQNRQLAARLSARGRAPNQNGNGAVTPTTPSNELARAK